VPFPIGAITGPYHCSPTRLARDFSFATVCWGSKSV